MQQLVGLALPFVPVWGDEDGLWAADAGRIGRERSQSQTGAAQRALRSPGRLVPLRLKHVHPGSSCSHLHHVNEAVQVTARSDPPGKSACKRRTCGTGSVCDYRETSQIQSDKAWKLLFMLGGEAPSILISALFHWGKMSHFIPEQLQMKTVSPKQHV